MSEFVITPTNIDFIESIFRNPITGKWSIPVLAFNTSYTSPFYMETNPLNNDPRYRKDVIRYIYMKLTEKWLYHDIKFRKLLRYFKISEEGKEGKVSLIDDPNKIEKETEEQEKYRNFIFRYIEKYFINKHLVSETVKQYIAKTHINWYDIFSNTDSIKKLLVHKLKKLIMSTIYELYDRKLSKEK